MKLLSLLPILVFTSCASLQTSAVVSYTDDSGVEYKIQIRENTPFQKAISPSETLSTDNVITLPGSSEQVEIKVKSLKSQSSK
jgi:hypothetical protein